MKAFELWSSFCFPKQPRKVDVNVAGILKTENVLVSSDIGQMSSWCWTAYFDLASNLSNAGALIQKDNGIVNVFNAVR